MLACSWAGDAGVLAPETLAAGAVALVAGVAFALVERRAPEPVVPVVELRHPTVLISTMLSLVVGAGLFSVVSYVPTYVQMVYGTSATEAGLIPIATVFGMLISSLLTGWLVSRSGRYRAFPRLGTAVGAAGLVVMAFLPLGLPLWAPSPRASELVRQVPHEMTAVEIAESSDAAARRNTSASLFGVPFSGGCPPVFAAIGMPLQKSDASCSSA